MDSSYIGNTGDFRNWLQKVSIFEPQSNESVQSNLNGNSIQQRFEIIDKTMDNLHQHINRLEILIHENDMCGSCEVNSTLGNGDNFNNFIQNKPIANGDPKQPYTHNVLFMDLPSNRLNIEPETVPVKLFIDEITSTVLAKYESVVYGIGIIDLTYYEYCCITMNNWNVVLTPSRRHIVILNDKLNIKRIPDYKMPETEALSSLCNISSIARVQFSTTLPILAKYNDEIFFIGDKLCEEYLNILKSFNQQIGAAIRIDKKFLTFDMVKQTLDITETTNFQNLQTFCSVNKSSNLNMHLEAEIKYYSNEYKRFVINNRPFTMLEVDTSLIYSFQGTEIFIYNNGLIGSGRIVVDEDTVHSLADWVAKRSYIESPIIEGMALTNDDLMDDDESAFFSQLFTERTSSPSDKFSNLIHPDDVLDSFEVSIQFFMEEKYSVPQARCQNVEYCIGFLDLTEEEYIYMSMIKWTTVLSIKTEYIQIRRNKLHIKRINQISYSKQSIAPGFGRIEFSTTEPLMAKFEGEIYFVGHKLYAEYINILDRIKKCTGTAVQIEEKFIMIDSSLRILDIQRYISFESQRVLCSSAASSKEYHYEHSSNQFRRYIFDVNDAHSLFEIDPKLIYSSECDEICICMHGTSNFEYDKFEWILFNVEAIEKSGIEADEEDIDTDEDDEQ